MSVAVIPVSHAGCEITGGGEQEPGLDWEVRGHVHEAALGTVRPDGVFKATPRMRTARNGRKDARSGTESAGSGAGVSRACRGSAASQRHLQATQCDGHENRAQRKGPHTCRESHPGLRLRGGGAFQAATPVAWRGATRE